MNYEIEAKEILSCIKTNDANEAMKSLLLSIHEFASMPAMNMTDVRQLIMDLYWEIESPEEKEIESPILEVCSNGLFDS